MSRIRDGIRGDILGAGVSWTSEGTTVMLGPGVEPQGDNALSARALGKVSRRTVLRLTAMAAAAAPTLSQLVSAPPAHAQADTSSDDGGAAIGDVVDVSIAQLRAAMAARRTTAREITSDYIDRIQRLDPRLHSVIEINPDAVAIAEALDDERQAGKVRGPLHGIPILLKDNIDTADKTHTGAGSLALVGTQPVQDATVARLLREAGAILLGKANLSEWANFRSTNSSSGWSARGGQCGNPYILDRNPCGSSSGSGAATSASFTAAALATETDGSIVCPASHCAVVGIKPTVGLTSRGGVVPISHTQDTIGSHGRTVADAAAVLTAIAGVEDTRDSATAINRNRPRLDYTKFLDKNALKGARIGVARDQGFGINPKTDAIMTTAIAALVDAGAVIIDNLNIGALENPTTGNSETTVLLFDFKQDVAAYMASRPGGPKTLQDLINFNTAHAAQELKFFGQELFLQAEATTNFNDPVYTAALADSQGASRHALNTIFATNNLAAIVAPTNSPAWTTDLVNGDHFQLASTGPAARAGFPLVTVPAGFTFDLPVGITFMGLSLSEPLLISLAFAFEQATKIRRPPKFLPTLPT
ncbi:MAG TPA: amidase [Chloroflexota bacterium]|nr:amidase [Chloroflexota bacterium]